jgi:hypothetical protein
MMTTFCPWGVEDGSQASAHAQQAGLDSVEMSAVRPSCGAALENKGRLGRKKKKIKKTKPRRKKPRSSVTAPWSRPETQVRDDSDARSDKPAMGLQGSRGSRKGNDVVVA